MRRKKVDRRPGRGAVCSHANEQGASLTDYARPSRLEDALALMAGGGQLVLAGGTDLYPGAGSRLKGPVLDPTALPELRGILQGPAGLRLGAAVTWAEIAGAALPPALAGLQAAARQVGARQVQNAGTLGGNICNASPAADGIPPLLTLEAEVELAGPSGMRRLPLADFVTGPRRVSKAAEELLVAVYLPASALAGRGVFLKLGARAHLVISIASVAVRCVTAGGMVTDIALAVGACSPVPRRLPQVEAALRGAPAAGCAARIRPDQVEAALAPIADIRATADYRRAAAAELLRRAVAEAVA